MDDATWRCPECGLSYEELPGGHPVFGLWPTGRDVPPSDEFLADLAKPIRLEPRATPFRDKPRSHDYPAGG